jgi:serine/threonine protein kinase
MEPKRFPFKAVYTVFGVIYIIFEVKGHFLGIGKGKVGCRCVNLQTAEILAAMELRSKFPEITDKKEEEEERVAQFNQMWKESEILIKFNGKQGILPLRDRLCFDVEQSQELYLFEGYFPDGSLDDYFNQIWDSTKLILPLPQTKKIQIGIQLLSGLKNIHEMGYVHGDIKPSNILLNLTSFIIPIAVISDFGSAYLSTDPYGALKAKHTPNVCPPEIAQIISKQSDLKQETDKPDLLFKADIWGMGCVFYCLFFDQTLPWAEDPRQDVYEQITQLKAGWIPEEHRHKPFFSLIEQMLEIDPVNRLTAEEALLYFLKVSKQLL